MSKTAQSNQLEHNMWENVSDKFGTLNSPMERAEKEPV